VDFTLDDTQREIADLASAVLRKVPDPQRTWQALADSGLLALAIPLEFDGDGLGVAEIAVLLTEVGRAACSTGRSPRRRRVRPSTWRTPRRRRSSARSASSKSAG
jgi:alkylation response protein AidB-like acyl-CoA dehydrogenase